MGDASSVSQHPASLEDALEVPALIKDQAFIGGKWMSGNATFPVYDPATNRTIANVANMQLKDFQAAIDYADGVARLRFTNHAEPAAVVIRF